MEVPTVIVEELELKNSNSSTITPGSSNGLTSVVNTVVCAPDDGWRYHPKHVEQFPEINRMCNVASCWIYKYIRM